MASGTIKAVASKADIDALNGKIELVKNTSVSGITLWKQGNIVVINIAKNSVTTNSNWETIATVPVGFRPPMEIAGFYDEVSGKRFVIDSSGNIMCSGIISSKNVRITGCYVVE